MQIKNWPETINAAQTQKDIVDGLSMESLTAAGGWDEAMQALLPDMDVPMNLKSAIRARVDLPTINKQIGFEKHPNLLYANNYITARRLFTEALEKMQKEGCKTTDELRKKMDRVAKERKRLNGLIENKEYTTAAREAEQRINKELAPFLLNLKTNKKLGIPDGYKENDVKMLNYAVIHKIDQADQMITKYYELLDAQNLIQQYVEWVRKEFELKENGLGLRQTLQDVEMGKKDLADAILAMRHALEKTEERKRISLAPTQYPEQPPQEKPKRAIPPTRQAPLEEAA